MAKNRMKAINKMSILSSATLVLLIFFQTIFNSALCKDNDSYHSISDLDLQARELIERVKSLSNLNNENSYSLSREYINKSLVRGIEEYSRGLFHSSAYSLKYFLDYSHRPSIEQLIAARYYLTLTIEKQGSIEETITQILNFFSVFNGLHNPKIDESKTKINHMFELALSNIYGQNFEKMDAYAIFRNLEKVQHVVLSKEFHSQGRFLVASIALQSKYSKNEKILDELYGNDKDNAEYIFLKSQHYIRSGNYAEGLQNLTLLLDSTHREPFKSLINISIARTYFILKKFSESVYFYSLIADQSYLKPSALYESIFAAINSNEKNAAISLSDDFLKKFPQDKNYANIKSIKDQINIQGFELAAFRMQSQENQYDKDKLYAKYLFKDSMLLNKENVYEFVKSSESILILPEDYKFIKQTLDKRNLLIDLDRRLFLELGLTTKKFIEDEGAQHLPHIHSLLNMVDEFLSKHMNLVTKAILLNKGLVTPMASAEQEANFSLLLKRLEDIKGRLFKKKNTILSQRKIVAKMATTIIYNEIFDRFNRVNSVVMAPANILKIALPNDFTNAVKQYQDRAAGINEEISLGLVDAEYYWYLDALLKQELEVLSLTFDELKTNLNGDNIGQLKSLSSRGALDNLYRSLDESENELRAFLDELSQRTVKFYSGIKEKTEEIRSIRRDFNVRITQLNSRIDGILTENHAKNVGFVSREFANQSSQSKRLSADALLLEVEMDEDNFKDKDERLKNLELENQEMSKRRKLGL